MLLLKIRKLKGVSNIKVMFYRSIKTFQTVFQLFFKHKITLDWKNHDLEFSACLNKNPIRSQKNVIQAHTVTNEFSNKI